jgi:hypothetical protein
MKNLKIYTLLTCLLWATLVTAQDLQDISCINLDSTATFEQHINCLLGNVNRSADRIPSRFLLENGYNLTHIDKWLGVRTDSNHTNIQQFLFNYYSIRSSYLGGLNTIGIEEDGGFTNRPNNKPIPVYHLPTFERMEKNIDLLNPAVSDRIKIPMFLIRYAQFKEDALDLGYLEVNKNQQVVDTPLGLANTPFVEKVAFVATTKDSSTLTNTATFFITGSTLATNFPLQSIVSIQVDFDNGQGYQTFAVPEQKTITWSGIEYQKKTIRYRVQLINGAGFEAHSYFHINTANMPVSERYNQITPDAVVNIFASVQHSGARLQISYSDSNKESRRITRPFIVFEGFDPGNTYGYGDFEIAIRDTLRSRKFFFNGVEDHFNGHLSAADRGNYDLIFVNYNDGADDIRRNARLAQEVIRWVNAQKLTTGSTEQNVVMGISMGGLVARYGLAQMVRGNEDSQVRLLITHDSPHRGATIPLGLQHLVRGVSKILPLRFIIKDLHIAARAIRSEAAKQLLLYRVDMDYPSPIPIPGVTTVDKNTWLDADYRPMVNIETPYRVIATSLGSECGEGIIRPGQELLSVSGSGLVSIPYFGLVKAGLSLRLKVWAGGESGNRNQVLDLQLLTEVRLFLDKIKVRVPIAGAWAKNEQGALPYEAMPGGTNIILRRNVNDSNQWMPGFGDVGLGITFDRELNARSAPGFCFVPTASALDVETFNSLTGIHRYSGGVSGNVKRLDSFMTQGEFYFDGVTNTLVRNFDHILFTSTQSQWLFNEMQNTPNNTLNCGRTCQPTANGYSSTIEQTCRTATFTLQNAPENVIITWTANAGNPRSGVGTVATVNASFGVGERITVVYQITTPCNTQRFTTPSVFIGIPPEEASAGSISFENVCPSTSYYYEYGRSHYMSSNDQTKTNDDFYWDVTVLSPTGELNNYRIPGPFYSVYYVNAGVAAGTIETSTGYYNGSCGWVPLTSSSVTYIGDVCYNSGRSIFPNPASDQLVIDGNSTTAEVIMYNKNSEIVYEGKTQPDQPLNIDTSQFNDDVYYLNIIDQNGVKTQRQIIIKKQK